MNYAISGPGNFAFNGPIVATVEIPAFSLGDDIFGAALSAQFIRSYVSPDSAQSRQVGVVNAQYRINGGELTSLGGVINGGDLLEVILSSSSSPSTTLTSTISVGSESVSLSVTTVDASTLQPSLARLIPGQIEVPLGEEFNFNIAEYFTDDSQLLYEAIGILPDGLDLDGISGELSGLASTSGTIGPVVFRAEELDIGRFALSNEVFFVVSSSIGAAGFPSRRNNIYRSPPRYPAYSQAVGENLGYSWDFGREAEIQQSKVKSITWENTAGEKSVISSVLLDGSKGHAMISVTRSGSSLITTNCTLENGSVLSARMRIVADNNGLFGYDYW